MTEFMHETVARREATLRRSFTGMTSNDFFSHMRLEMTYEYNRMLAEQRILLPTDPWAAVEARNNEEHNVHYSGGPF